MMEKLLHERLRNSGRLGETYVLLEDGLKRAFINQEGMFNLADEIERCYIPLPRYEDNGEPVNFGCEFGDGLDNPHTLHEIVFRDELARGTGAPCLLRSTKNGGLDDGISFNLWRGERVKRPKPKNDEGPDNLERIKADRELNIYEYEAKHEMNGKTKAGHLLDRAIALIERGA